jgi:hypothetical protein
MIVRCISLSSATGDEIDSSPWLKVGTEYVVLSIEENAQGERYYVLEPHLGHSDSVGFFSSLGFEVVNESWPLAWIEERANGEISVAPKAWQRAGFWEDFHEGDLQAQCDYREERDKIRRCQAE